ncbi:MAG: FAD-binding oxidoreductase [Saprospiraceae bacterium]|nr:FAD-binding oxidoreductase [Saprospiraceae bacterium]
MDFQSFPIPEFRSPTFLIVGQGIAGTLLAYFLLKAKQNIIVIDNHHKNSSSKAAAGIINPITGRKYVKSWRVDELLPFAKQTYQELEQLLSIKCYHERNVIRTMSNAKELNDWTLRTLEQGYAKYISDEVDLGNYKNKTTPAFGYGEVLQGAQVDLPLIIHQYRNLLKKENLLIEEAFDFEQLTFNNNIQYKNLNPDIIIFCEGAKMKENPFFNYLPIQGDKGEALIIKIPDANFEKMLKQQIFIVPLDNGHGAFSKPTMPDLYWVGTTYERNYSDDLPSEKGLKYLTDHLEYLLKIPFEVVQHLAAVRPTVRDRRPFLGLHPQFPQLAIFNGLGTKGASLGPFWAKHLADFLINGTPLDEEVDIQRFGNS